MARNVLSGTPAAAASVVNRDRRDVVAASVCGVPASRNFTMSCFVDCAWASSAANATATVIANHTGILPFITRLDMKTFL